MEVRYTTTMDDLIDAMVHVRRNMPFMRRVRQLIVVLFVFGGGLQTWILFAKSPAAALFVGLLTIVFVAVYPQFHRVTERRHVGKQINAMGARWRQHIHLFDGDVDGDHPPARVRARRRLYSSSGLCDWQAWKVRVGLHSPDSVESRAFQDEPSPLLCVGSSKRNCLR